MRGDMFFKAKKYFFFNEILNVVFLTTFAILLIAKYKFGIALTPNENGHYYFFSSVAQSMAAIIAIAGSIGVFNYSLIPERLKKLNQLTQEHFQRSEFIRCFSTLDSLTWHDDGVIARAKANDADKNPPEIKTDLRELIPEMEREQQLLDNYIPSAIPSLLSTSATFFLALSFVPLSTWFTRARTGDTSILFSLYLIAISLRSIFGFFTSLLQIKRT